MCVFFSTFDVVVVVPAVVTAAAVVSVYTHNNNTRSNTITNNIQGIAGRNLFGDAAGDFGLRQEEDVIKPPPPGP